MKDIGPAQFFVSSDPTDDGRERESTAILWDESRAIPALMKNPQRYDLEGRIVPQDQVEELGLKRFTKDELDEQGWDYIPLFEVDLSGRKDSRPAYAVEQQFQYKTEDLKLGIQRLNRTPGAGNWNVEPRGTVMVGFAFAPRGWLEEHEGAIAIVEGKQRQTKTRTEEALDVDFSGLNVVIE